MLVSLLAEYGDLKVKIKEITEGIMDVIRNRVAAGPGSDFTKWSNYGGTAPRAEPEADDTDTDTDTDTSTDTDTTTDTPQPDADTSTDTTTDTPQPDADTSTDNEQPNTQQPRQQQQRQQQTRPQGNPNQNINTKIDYLKSIGVLQSARITDREKQYIESTDVWVDSNKLQDIDPDTTFFQTRAPHHHMFLRQIVVPGRDLGYDNNVNYQYSLTPAGWWSPMHNGYINPNSKLGQLVDNWAESH